MPAQMFPSGAGTIAYFTVTATLIERVMLPLVAVTTTVKMPVGETTGAGLLLLPPPQPIPVMANANSTRLNMAVHFRRRDGTPITRTPANMPPPLTANQAMPLERCGVEELPSTAWAIAVFTVRVAVALGPLSATDAGMEQVIVNVVDTGGAQVRSTVPLKPLTASTVTVDVPMFPAVATVTAVPATV